MSRGMTSVGTLAVLLALVGCPGPQEQDGPGPTGATDPAAPEGDPQGDPPAGEPPPEGGAAPDGAPAASPDPDVEAVSKRAALSDPTLEGWVEQALEVPPERFAASEPFRAELSRYLVESSGATSMFLLPAVDPHRGAKAGVTWRAKTAGADGLDLLRCDYEAAGQSVRLTEGVNVLILRLTPTAKPAPPLNSARLAKLVEAFVRTQRDEGEWTFAWPEGDLGSGTHLVSSEGAPPVAEVGTRDERADVLVVEGKVFLIFYKRLAKRIGFEAGDAWFRESTREAMGG